MNRARRAKRRAGIPLPLPDWDSIAKPTENLGEPGRLFILSWLSTPARDLSPDSMPLLGVTGCGVDNSGFSNRLLDFF
jgi:hypothetical protein